MKDLIVGQAIALKRVRNHGSRSSVQLISDCMVSVVKDTVIYVRGYDGAKSKPFEFINGQWQYKCNMGLYSTQSEYFYVISVEECARLRKEAEDEHLEKVRLELARERFASLTKDMKSDDFVQLVELVEAVKNKDIKEIVEYSRFLPEKGI
jgi:hypothetical protein